MSLAQKSAHRINRRRNEPGLLDANKVRKGLSEGDGASVGEEVGVVGDDNEGALKGVVISVGSCRLQFKSARKKFNWPGVRLHALLNEHCAYIPGVSQLYK